MSNSISETHEWRELSEFREGDYIHRWGYDLLVIKVLGHDVPGSGVTLTYHDTDGQDKSITNRKGAQYIALKR